MPADMFSFGLLLLQLLHSVPHQPADNDSSQAEAAAGDTSNPSPSLQVHHCKTQIAATTAICTTFHSSGLNCHNYEHSAHYERGVHIILGE